MHKQIHYPFSAIVGQEMMCLALILNVIDPAIGGVLIRGEKGTAKTTAARSLAAMLPDIEIVEGCPYPLAVTEVPGDIWPHPANGIQMRTVPFIDLPLGVTEDRLLGTIDLEAALQRGERRFQAGLLADAHRGILYIDEVNLLGDHLVDVLLDAAATGRNTVEREGVSFSHPARFILIGTMNPEEGDLRPQLLDRFGLAVEVRGPQEVSQRTEIVRRRLAFESAPEVFAARFAASDQGICEVVESARQILHRVVLDEEMLELIAHISLSFQVDGMRADLVMVKTARALAAWEGRSQVISDDVRTAAELALLHRRRRQPFEQPGLDREQLQEVVQQHQRESAPQETAAEPP
jgi:magnesium chelatase subunit D